MQTVDLSDLLCEVVRSSFTWRTLSTCLSSAAPDRKTQTHSFSERLQFWPWASCIKWCSNSTYIASLLIQKTPEASLYTRSNFPAPSSCTSSNIFLNERVNVWSHCDSDSETATKFWQQKKRKRGGVFSFCLCLLRMQQDYSSRSINRDFFLWHICKLAPTLIPMQLLFLESCDTRGWGLLISCCVVGSRRSPRWLGTPRLIHLHAAWMWSLLIKQRCSSGVAPPPSGRRGGGSEKKGERRRRRRESHRGPVMLQSPPPLLLPATITWLSSYLSGQIIHSQVNTQSTWQHLVSAGSSPFKHKTHFTQITI